MAERSIHFFLSLIWANLIFGIIDGQMVKRHKAAITLSWLLVGLGPSKIPDLSLRLNRIVHCFPTFVPDGLYFASSLTRSESMRYPQAFDIDLLG